MIDPKDDGKTHLNIYSKGLTKLGRFLSNFADCDIQTEDGYFRTIEGYWYWLSTRDGRLRNLPGWECKTLGRKLRGDDWLKDPAFEKKIMKAIIVKISTNEWCIDELKKSAGLPFYHYYTYGPKVMMVKDGLWVVSLISEFRDELVKVSR